MQKNQMRKNGKDDKDSKDFMTNCFNTILLFCCDLKNSTTNDAFLVSPKVPSCL